VVSHLRLRRRGCRAGAHYKRHTLSAQTVKSAVCRTVHPGEIPTITGNRKLYVNSGHLFHGRRDERVSVIKPVRRCGFKDNVRVGLFNARSVSNKTASIQQWIRDEKLSLAALVETWHDDVTSPDLIACVPPGFSIIERARPRKNSSQRPQTTAASVCCTTSRYESVPFRCRHSRRLKSSARTFIALVSTPSSSSCTGLALRP